MSVNGIVPHILMMPTQKGSGAGDYQQSKTPGSRSVHIPTSAEQVHTLLQLQTCLFFCFAINILTALGAVQHVLCDCYADKIFCEFSPHQCFSFGLSQLGSLPSKMDCFDQSIWWFDGWHGIKFSNAFFQLLCAVAIFNPTVGSLRGSSWRFVLPLSRYEGSFINNPEMQTSILIVQKQMWANRISTKTHILCHIL